MTREIWKPVVGFEGMYEVYDLGRVRSLDRVVTSPDAKSGYPKRICGRVLKLQKHSGGYAQVGLGRAGSALVHVLVLESFVGPRPEDHEGCHFDGDKTNNRLDNVRWGTREDNCADKEKHGTDPRGERNGMAVLTDEDVKRIRESSGTYAQIAAKYPVSDRTIGKIKRGERWTHV